MSVLSHYTNYCALLLDPGELSRILRGDLTPAIMATALALAFVLGAIHAMSPGHGKTLVAAYLVGSRGTARHAVFLGAMVTFTHTASVFALGFVTLYLSEFVAPDTLTPILGVISGLAIVWIGAALLIRRARALAGGGDGGHHHHTHDHDHEHEHGHSHLPEGDVSLGSLIALGASGGLVPCPSALVLLLTAISLHRTGAGMVLLVSFSLGLAAVLTAIGLAVIYVGQLLPDRDKASNNKVFRYLPVASAAVILCVGVVMTAASFRS